MHAMFQPVIDLLKVIKGCEKAGISIAAAVMVYIGIDTMAFLALPSGRDKQGKADFIAWADKYMRGYRSQPYQYRGKDLYAARCALLHAFSSETDFHRADPDANKYVYSNGGRHCYDPSKSSDLVIIGLASLINDFVIAVEAFLREAEDDADLRQRIETRLPKLLANFPLAGREG